MSFRSAKKRRSSPISYWRKQADKWFSYFIRLAGTTNGVCRCYTCSCYMHPKNAHCGHYVGRQHTPTRYNIINCHPQCEVCNTFNEGEKRKYAARLDQEYGQGTAEGLERMGKTRGKYGALWYQVISQEYMAKANALAEETGIKWW